MSKSVRVVEEFQMCDDALGKWVLRAVYPDKYPSDVRSAVIKQLMQIDRARWNIPHTHPDSFFTDRAIKCFESDWRVRTVPTGELFTNVGDP